MFKIITIKKNQLAIIYKNGEVTSILPAGNHRLYHWLNQLSVRFIDLAQAQVETTLADYLINFYPELVKTYCISVELESDEIALRYQDKKLVEVVLPNRRVLYWQGYLQQEIITVKLEKGYQLPKEIAYELYQVANSKEQVLGLEQLKLAFIIKEQIGILFIDNELVEIIAGGNVVAFCSYQHQVILATYAIRDSQPINEKIAEAIRQALPDSIAIHCVEMKTNANEAGLRYENDLLVEILPPGSQRLYWKSTLAHRLTNVKLDEGYCVAESIIQQLIQPNLRKKAVIGDNSILIAQIPAYSVGVLKVDGQVQQLLTAGITAYWRFNREINVEIIDTRLQTMEVSGQEILTRDKVSLRLNLLANWRFNDVLKAHALFSQPQEYLYRELQFGLREAVGTRTLDELLENKNIIDQVISEHIAQKMQTTGIESLSLGVKDIILPGEMKTILAQVVEAEKSAQANVIRRREETAATRSLLNTAKVMENNPVALRLKEMETLERIAERIDKISVVGGLDQILHGLVNIQPNGLINKD